MPAPAMRFHLAMLHRNANRPDSAAAWLRSLVPPATWLGFYTARASYELAEIVEQRGELGEARRMYASALAYWSSSARRRARGPSSARSVERASRRARVPSSLTDRSRPDYLAPAQP